MDKLKKLGDFLKKNRSDNKMSQRQVAEELGVSRDTVYSWEAGIKEIGGIKLLNLSEIINFDFQELKRLLKSENGIEGNVNHE